MMARNRKTKAEQRAEQNDAERSAWEEFSPKLAAARSYVEARLLLRDMPRPDAPGRCFYTNLVHFLDNFSVPAGASYEEDALYLRLIERLAAARELKPEARERVAKELRAVMAKQGP
jgi:hypothetical protein